MRKVVVISIFTLSLIFTACGEENTQTKSSRSTILNSFGDVEASGALQDRHIGFKVASLQDVQLQNLAVALGGSYLIEKDDNDNLTIVYNLSNANQLYLQVDCAGKIYDSAPVELIDFFATNIEQIVTLRTDIYTPAKNNDSCIAKIRASGTGTFAPTELLFSSNEVNVTNNRIDGLTFSPDDTLVPFLTDLQNIRVSELNVAPISDNIAYSGEIEAYLADNQLTAKLFLACGSPASNYGTSAKNDSNVLAQNMNPGLLTSAQIKARLLYKCDAYLIDENDVLIATDEGAKIEPLVGTDGLTVQGGKISLTLKLTDEFIDILAGELVNEITIGSNVIVEGI